MKRILIDTDVILDFFFDRKPFAETAAKILSLCESKEVTGFVTSVIVSNTYYILRQNSPHEKVISNLRLLLSITDVLTTNKEIIITALNSEFKDFEDALQNYSAEENGQIDIIVTRNIKDYKTSKLGVMTPDNYLKIASQSHN